MANRRATFEIFVSQAVQKLMNDASWSRQTKDLRKQCTEVLGTLPQRMARLTCVPGTFTLFTTPAPTEMMCTNSLLPVRTARHWGYAVLRAAHPLTGGSIETGCATQTSSRQIKASAPLYLKRGWLVSCSYFKQPVISIWPTCRRHAWASCTSWCGFQLPSQHRT